MLIIISDLHLTDGQSGQTISKDAFRIFSDEIRLAITSASYQKKTVSSDAGVQTQTFFDAPERCDIILNGDILDVIRSQAWLDDNAPTVAVNTGAGLKPWDDHSSEHYIRKIDQITDSILEHNNDSLKYLRELTVKQGVEVMSADGEKYHVRIYLHYMVGNHDWFYHLPYAGMRAIREKIINAMGLSNDPSAVFPHRLDEQAAENIRAICLQHQVYVQHGDIYDPVNYVAKKGRDYSSLGDAIVILLLNSYPEKVRETLTLDKTDPLYLKLKEIDNVRPVTDVPGWIYGVLKHHATPAQYDSAIRVWNAGIGELVGHPFVKSVQSHMSLKERLKFATSFGITRILPLWLMTWITDKFISGESDLVYQKAAMKEEWLRQDSEGRSKALYVCYGHTHDELILPIDEVTDEGVRKNQIYFNSGTWRLVHRRAQKHKRQFEYAHFHVMTYLAFYKGSERSGRPYETWSGRLGSD